MREARDQDAAATPSSVPAAESAPLTDVDVDFSEADLADPDIEGEEEGQTLVDAERVAEALRELRSLENSGIRNRSPSPGLPALLSAGVTPRPLVTPLPTSVPQAVHAGGNPDLQRTVPAMFPSSEDDLLAEPALSSSPSLTSSPAMPAPPAFTASAPGLTPPPYPAPGLTASRPPLGAPAAAAVWRATHASLSSPTGLESGLSSTTMPAGELVSRRQGSRRVGLLIASVSALVVFLGAAALMRSPAAEKKPTPVPAPARPTAPATVEALPAPTPAQPEAATGEAVDDTASPGDTAPAGAGEAAPSPVEADGRTASVKSPSKSESRRASALAKRHKRKGHATRSASANSRRKASVARSSRPGAPSPGTGTGADPDGTMPLGQ